MIAARRGGAVRAGRTTRPYMIATTLMMAATTASHSPRTRPLLILIRTKATKLRTSPAGAYARASGNARIASTLNEGFTSCGTGSTSAAEPDRATGGLGYGAKLGAGGAGGGDVAADGGQASGIGAP
ncbi:MAG TPA: hypothetical protein VGQ83_27385 [Polyangia bacterium]|jgi:hypothetical protein